MAVQNKSRWSSVVESRVWRSFFRHGWPDNPLDRSLAMTSNIFFHLHPVKVSRKSIRWTYSFGLGVMATILFGVLIFTGVLLMFYYIPSVERAYPSMKEIQLSVPLGQFTRNMHRWAAHLMVLVVILHMVRVFYTGAYKPPREFNWIVGVGLLMLTLGASFTGYLLPWDQLSIWAITVGSNMARAVPLVGSEGPAQQLLTVGGIDLITSGSDSRFILLGASQVGEETLVRFYVLHCVAIPLLAAFGMAVHFWRVRKDGGISGPL